MKEKRKKRKKTVGDLAEFTESVRDTASWAEENGNERGQIVSQIANELPKEFGTLKQRKVLAIEMIPEYAELNIRRKCEIIGISSRYWYHVINRDDYSELSVKAARRMKGQFAPRIMGRFLQNALTGGKEGDGDTRAQIAYLRDMDLLKSEEKGGDTTVNVNVVVQGQKQIEENRRIAYTRLRYSDN